LLSSIVTMAMKLMLRRWRTRIFLLKFMYTVKPDFTYVALLCMYCSNFFKPVKS
jgi:hypothetical protein